MVGLKDKGLSSDVILTAFDTVHARETFLLDRRISASGLAQSIMMI